MQIGNVFGWVRNSISCIGKWLHARWRDRHNDEYSLPPSLKPLHKLYASICFVAALVALIAVVDQFVLDAGIASYFFENGSRPAVVYVSIPVLVIVIIAWQALFHPMRQFHERIEDRSEIESLLNQTKQLEPRVGSQQDLQKALPINFKQKKSWCEGEAKRLVEELGPRAWTEMATVPLQQSLSDFLKIEDLKAEADNVLTDLNDYATSARTPYDIREYEGWKSTIEEEKEKIRKEGTDKQKDVSAEPLRAQLKVLYEYLAGYKRSWAQGSAITSALRTTCVLLIPLLLLLALTPVCHENGGGVLNVKHWGILGVAGALTAVLYQLRNSDLVEIGNTEGTGELRQAIGAAALGLVAGVITWSLIAAGIFGLGGSGSLVPQITDPPASTRNPEEWLPYVGKSILWGIAAGFSLQRVFGRLRSATFGD